MFRSDDQVLSMLPGPCVLREPVLRELARQSEAYFLPYFDEQMVDLARGRCTMKNHVVGEREELPESDVFVAI